MEKQPPVQTDTSGLPTNGHSRPAHLSSNTTLLWRVFLPVFGTVFITGFLLAVVMTSEDDLYLQYPAWILRVPILAIWLGWLYYVWRGLLPLKRIDADDAHLFITNYWTTVRYPWTDVERMEEEKYWGRKIIRLRLKGPGRFGQEIVFIPGSHYSDWMRENQKLIVS